MRILQAMTVALAFVSVAHAQVNTGSNGSDGAFNPTTNTVVDMNDHPDGIYQFASVSIPTNVTVTFIPNAKNTPVVWLVQGDVVITGSVDVSGQSPQGLQGGRGGTGGYPGGNGGPQATPGQGPGGGAVSKGDGQGYGSYSYGNAFLVPLLGGSGGGGLNGGSGGGGGGGVILIAAANTITLNGTVAANGGTAPPSNFLYAGNGSGGAVRLVASRLAGSGAVSAIARNGAPTLGRVRFDSYENDFSGVITGQFAQGSQFVLIPSSGQLPQLSVTSVGGVPVSTSPTGVLYTPDAVLSAQQNNPIPIVVNCLNLPLNSQITVNVKSASGAAVMVSATGYNNTGTPASSTATVSINMPRGGGLIYATAATSN